MTTRVEVTQERVTPYRQPGQRRRLYDYQGASALVLIGILKSEWENVVRSGYR